MTCRHFTKIKKTFFLSENNNIFLFYNTMSLEYIKTNRNKKKLVKVGYEYTIHVRITKQIDVYF